MTQSLDTIAPELLTTREAARLLGIGEPHAVATFAQRRGPGPGGDRRHGPLSTIGTPRLDSGRLPANRRENAAMNCDGCPQEGGNEGERRKQNAAAALEQCRETIVTEGRRLLLRRLLDHSTATADDVRQTLAARRHRPADFWRRAPGPAALGIIRPAGFVRSVRPARHTPGYAFGSLPIGRRRYAGWQPIPMPGARAW